MVHFADEFSYNIHHEGESFNSIFNFSAFESFSNCLSIKLCLTYEDSNMRFFCLKLVSHYEDLRQDLAKNTQVCCSLMILHVILFYSCLFLGISQNTLDESQQILEVLNMFKTFVEVFESWISDFWSLTHS